LHGLGGKCLTVKNRRTAVKHQTFRKISSHYIWQKLTHAAVVRSLCYS